MTGVGRHQRQWSKLDDDVIRNMYAEGEATQKIANLLNVSRTALIARAGVLGVQHPCYVKNNTIRRFTNEQLAFVLSRDMLGISPENRIVEFLKKYPRSGLDVVSIAGAVRKPSRARAELESRNKKIEEQKEKKPVEKVQTVGNSVPDIGELLVKIYNELLVIEKIQLERLEIVKRMVDKKC